MPECSQIKRKKQQVCIADLDTLITIQNRSIEGITTTSDFAENFTDYIEIWALINTAGSIGSGRTEFNGSNIEVVVSHDIYIRYDSSVTAESWVELDAEKYDIIKTIDLDNRHEWMLLKCNIRGDNTKPVNFA